MPSLLRGTMRMANAEHACSTSSSAERGDIIWNPMTLYPMVPTKTRCRNERASVPRRMFCRERRKTEKESHWSKEVMTSTRKVRQCTSTSVGHPIVARRIRRTARPYPGQRNGSRQGINFSRQPTTTTASAQSNVVSASFQLLQFSYSSLWHTTNTFPFQPFFHCNATKEEEENYRKQFFFFFVL